MNAHRSLSIVCVTIAALSLPHRAAAQGNSQNHGRAARQPATAKAPAAPAPSLPAGTGVRNFGAWLDDTSIVDPHTGWAGFSLGYWKSPLGHQIDMPSSDIGYGLSRSVQVGFTMPYYRSRFGTDGAAGLGDVYLNAKINLIDSTRNPRRAGVAVIPVVEILSGLPDGSNRWHWGAPVSAEIQVGPARVYGAAGYFSRGATFGSGAVEWTSSRNYTVTGSLTRSYSLADDPLSDALGLNRHRLDASGSVSRAIAKSIAVYGGVARTLSRTDANSTVISLNAGFVTFFNGPVQTPARRKRK